MRPPALAPALIMAFLALAPALSGGALYEECPRCLQTCNECQSSPCKEQCSDSGYCDMELTVCNKRVALWGSIPHGNVAPGQDVEVLHAEASMLVSPSRTGFRVQAFDCSTEEFQDLGDFVEPSTMQFEWRHEVTAYIEDGCEGRFALRIDPEWQSLEDSPSGEGTLEEGPALTLDRPRSIGLEEVTLVVNYEIVEPNGHLEAFLDAPQAAVLGTAFSASSEVACNSGPCGIVDTYLMYQAPYGLEELPTSPGEAPFHVDSNPHPDSCPELMPGDYCLRTWQVHADRAGSHSLAVLASSRREGVLDAESDAQKITVNEGGLTPYLTLYDTGDLGRHDEFRATGRAECGEGSCGDASLALQYAGSADSATPVWETVPAVSGTAFYVDEQNPKHCGEVSSNTPCSQGWSVHANSTGDYLLRLAVLKDGSVAESTGSEEVTVNLGSLTLDNVIYNDSSITIGESARLSAYVSCRYYCGEASVMVKNGTSKVTPGDPYFDISEGIQGCGIMKDGVPCHAEWELRPRFPGEHAGIYVYATSSEGGNSGIYPEPPLQVHEMGYLEFEQPGLSTGTISEGEDASMYGTVACRNNYCGEVTVRAMMAGKAIPSSGPGVTTPDSSHRCHGMGTGDACYPSFQLTGNEEGTYHPYLRAESTDPGVDPAESEELSLTVERQLGDIILDGLEISDRSIFTGDTTQATAIVSCSSEYCGAIDSYLEYGDGALIGTTGNLTTTGNPMACEQDPCHLAWEVTGNRNDTYILRIRSELREYAGISNTTFFSVPLEVSLPGGPATPKATLTPLKDLSVPLGEDFLLTLNAYCTGADCGSLTGSLQISQAGSWGDLSADTPIRAVESQQEIQLLKDEAGSFEWNLTGSEPGSYQLRATVSGPLISPVHTNGFTVEVIQPGVVQIEIIEPAGTPVQVYSRGDSVPCRIRMTENDIPKDNLQPLVALSGFTGQYPLASQGDGVYTGGLVVPAGAGGEHLLTVSDGGSQAERSILVDPSLRVSITPGRASYRVSEDAAFSGSVARRGEDANATVFVRLERCLGGGEGDEIRVRADSGGYFSGTYRLSGIPSGRNCHLAARAEDGRGNEGFSSAAIYILADVDEVYKVEIEDPGGPFITGEEVTVRARVLEKGIEIPGANVSCRDPRGSTFSLEPAPEGYEGSFMAVGDPDGEAFELGCRASKGELYGWGFMEVPMRPVIEISVLSPTEEQMAEGISEGEEIQLIVEVSYLHGGPLENGSVNVTVGDRVIPLRHGDRGLYYLNDFEVEDEGELVLTFSAGDSRGNIRVHEMSLLSVGSVIVNWAGIIMMASGVVILGTLWFAYSTRKGKTIVKTVTRTVVKGPDRRAVIKDRLADLEKERRAIEKAKEEAEMEYYQRRITESEFKKMMEDYEQDLLKVQAEIREFQSELRTLKG